jgi:hypothetical protein
MQAVAVELVMVLQAVQVVQVAVVLAVLLLVVFILLALLEQQTEAVVVAVVPGRTQLDLALMVVQE